METDFDKMKSIFSIMGVVFEERKDVGDFKSLCITKWSDSRIGPVLLHHNKYLFTGDGRLAACSSLEDIWQE